MIKRILPIAAAFGLLAGGVATAADYPPYVKPGATPEEDVRAIQGFFAERYPNVPFEEYANGLYAFDEGRRAEWQMIEEFPPYEPAIERGEQLFNTAFANGKTYRDCFGGTAVADQYPRWDDQLKTVVTLGYAVNLCREANGEKALNPNRGDLVDITAYLAYQVRGRKVNVQVPTDNPGAMAAYNAGKEFYFTRRGQLNLACFHCHFDTAGQLLRANRLGPALGQTTHMPKYRSKWGEMGSLHRRYGGCNRQVRAKSFPGESEVYRNLEYFHTHMSNGLPWNGPGSRF